MTGVADLYLYLKHGRRKPLLARLWNSSSSIYGKKESTTCFVVLAWKRTGSNLLCGILYHHPEIIMHNELFNTIDIFTYYPELIDSARWSVLTRDLFPEEFLDELWLSSKPIKKVTETIGSETISTSCKKAIGFKSFPEHWAVVRNELVWSRAILENHNVKKIVLKREDELAVYVSSVRADETGLYLGMTYPDDLKVYVNPAFFQRFVNNYRDTYKNKYKSPWAKRDTFYITYEQLTDEATFRDDILPQLWNFLNVDPTVPLRKLAETTKQADPDEDLSKVISNYDELEFCFRYSDVTHFAKRRKEAELTGITTTMKQPTLVSFDKLDPITEIATWSILLPICSRGKQSQNKPRHSLVIPKVNTNRFLQLTREAQHDPENTLDDLICWSMLEDVCNTLHNTASCKQLEKTEVIVGIDVDDQVYYTDEAKNRIELLLSPCCVNFVDIQKTMYGKVCSIWSHLAKQSVNDYVVLLGDDICLLDVGWQTRVVQGFHAIALETGLPLGAACVCLNDISFPGFPTFPVVHRWHINLFKTLLPKQFVNQGGDPYLYELYSRFNAACFVTNCRLENRIGGDGDARYRKHNISWDGQILSMNVKKLQAQLGADAHRGFVMDIVVPAYRINNRDILTQIATLRSSVKAYVKFWFVIDNPDPDNVQDVKDLAAELNKKQLECDSNYFINVIHYSENRGASYARNTGYNYSTADWILFLDDDVLPESNIIDAYIGAVQRYPEGKVFVGHTELPDACNMWTEMLKTCNVGYFYGIAGKMVHPSWGVTANLMVHGSRYNRTIQFKSIFPKTGGGEDIDFVYQYKAFYSNDFHVTVGVPEAIVKHPWWRNGGVCYSQITGWAKGDSMCITEWPNKTFLTFPNWIEHITFIVLPLAIYMQRPLAGFVTMSTILLVEHLGKGRTFYSNAIEVTGSSSWRTVFIALGAGTVLSSQEIQRVFSLIQRRSLFSMCRRVDWFDGQKMAIKLDIQLTSIWAFAVNTSITFLVFYFTKQASVQFCWQ
jgi:glycosyltransferase involved in cell wall biosynthesis/LPS sulfotransferase NodH